MTVSVLMPVHAGSDPEHLRVALQSIRSQTHPPDEVVIVVDGDLTDAHEDVLTGEDRLIVIRLPKQPGVGAALKVGLEVCKGEYVARADSDDVNEPHRLSRQLEVLAATEADVCASAMSEFSAGDTRIRVRSTPLHHREFLALMRWRNPVNHPSVIFRRSAALEAGGYQHLAFLEDYDLWARMIMRGSSFIGLREPLVRYRTDGMHERRTVRALDDAERDLQRRLTDYGLVTRRQARLNLVLRYTYRRLPRPVLTLAYAVIFRRRSA